MNKHWSIDEILIKLPLISVKLKAPVMAAKESRKDAQSMVLVEGYRGSGWGSRPSMDRLLELISIGTVS